MHPIRIALTICVFLVALHAPSSAQDCNPSHCGEAHNHTDPAWTGANLQACPWKQQIDWCFHDTGFNEGAGCAAGVAGVKVPDPGGQALGNVWKRRDMMNAAKDLAKNNVDEAATSVALCCQYHNCHACRCLDAHRSEIAGYLRTK